MKRWVWAMFAAAVELCAHGARAQSDEALSGVLQIQSQAAPCLTETALRERVRHWLAAPAAATGVTVVVDAAADPPAFRVLRGGAVIALRRFALLPSACADRLDAIALPVALAIEQANAASSAPSSAAASTAAGAANATAPSGSATSKTPENLAQPETKPAASPAADAAHADKATATTAGQAARASAGANPSAEQPHKDAGEAPQPQAAEVDTRAEVSRSDADSASRWRLFAAGSLLFEALPHTVVALEAGPELRLTERLSVSLGALVTAQTEHTLGSVHSQAQLFGGRALLCARWPLGAFGFDACAGAIGGAVAVNTRGADTRQTLAWVAGLARAALSFPVRSAVSVRLGLSGLLNAVRPRLLANGSEPRAAVAGVVGAETSLELLIALP